MVVEDLPQITPSNIAPQEPFCYASSMANLFQSAGLEAEAPTPLAEALRPAVLEDVVGQSHLIGPEGPIGRCLLYTSPSPRD